MRGRGAEKMGGGVGGDKQSQRGRAKREIFV